MEEKKALNFLFKLYMPFMLFFRYIVTVEYGMTWEHYDKDNSRKISLEEVICRGGGSWTSVMLQMLKQF